MIDLYNSFKVKSAFCNFGTGVAEAGAGSERRHRRGSEERRPTG
jgi:hypothetical protein